jgi:hypothetical protein
MEILIFKPHSVIDVITNSSSEIFVCETNKTVERVKEILQELLNIYNKKWKDENPESRDLEFDNCFGSIYKIETRGQVNTLLDELGWYNSDWGGDLYEDAQKSARNWAEKEGKENFNKYLGSIVIESAMDNTIPSELFDIIEHGFNAKRTHLG